MTFTKTVGGKNPWVMPLDGAKEIVLNIKTKRWERRQYAKAVRREAKKHLLNNLARLSTELT